MYNNIIAELDKIEKEHNICILYALESGSRGWGFESKDSDYDVRFIYIHTLNWYLSIDDRRDVIEYPINNLLDISGWDIKKALKLFKKSNPPLLEWLRSPIIYIDKFNLAEKLRDIVNEFFSPKNCIYHYLNMAKGNYREYLKGETVKIKKYFYVLRPILACKWIEKHQIQNLISPPMEFAKLIEDAKLDKNLYNEIEKLLIRKKAGEELDLEPQLTIINEFLEKEINHFEDYVKNIQKNNSPDYEILNNLFIEMLREVW